MSLSYKYKPEVDDTAKLNLSEIRFYQEFIGILRWAVELGWIDIQFEVSMVSSYMASPRIGHLETYFWIFTECSKVNSCNESINARYF